MPKYSNPRTAKIMRDIANDYAKMNAADDQLKAWALDVGYSKVMESDCPSWLKGWMSRRLMYGDDYSE